MIQEHSSEFLLIVSGIQHRVPRHTDFPHLARHLMTSLPARSVGTALTLFRSRCTRGVSLQRLMRRHPLPSPGSLGWSPWLSGTTRRSDSLPSLSPHFVSFAWRYHRCVRGSSPQAPDGSRGSAWSW